MHFCQTQGFGGTEPGAMLPANASLLLLPSLSAVGMAAGFGKSKSDALMCLIGPFLDQTACLL